MKKTASQTHKSFQMTGLTKNGIKLSYGQVWIVVGILAVQAVAQISICYQILELAQSL